MTARINKVTERWGNASHSLIAEFAGKRLSYADLVVEDAKTKNDKPYQRLTLTIDGISFRQPIEATLLKEGDYPLEGIISFNAEGVIKSLEAVTA